MNSTAGRTDRSSANLAVERGADASVTLLATIVDSALDPGYADAAQRRATSGSSSRARSVGVGALVALAVAGVIIGVSVRDVRSTTVPQAREARDALAVRVEDRVVATDALERRWEQLRDEVAALTLAAEGATPTRSLQRQVQAGTIAVTGPGLVVAIDDADQRPADGTGSDDDADLGRVLDRDLQTVANGLWAAGAEAIAINGHRLTSTAAIRSAGEAILVDYRPLARPYVVEAIGPDEMRERFQEGSAGLALRTVADTYGIRFSIDESDGLALDAGTDSPLRYARPNIMKGELVE
jgi:uncharacterized protein YlxW (UPF0749 family)